MGVCGKMGVDVVMRQTFYGNNYAAVGDDLYPRPVCLTSIHIFFIMGKEHFN